MFRGDYLLAGRTIAAGDETTLVSRVFAGAKLVDLVDGYADEGVTRFDLLIDWGWFISDQADVPRLAVLL